MSGIMLACAAVVGSSAASSGGALTLVDETVSDYIDVGTAVAGLQLTNAGATNGIVGIGGYSMTPWLVPGTAASDYEVLATLTGGTPTSGTTGSWLSLGTTRAWEVGNAAPWTVQYVSINLAIRRLGGDTILATCSLVFVATVGG